MSSSSAQSPSKRRLQATRLAMSESQLQAYFLARETLRRLKGLAASNGVNKAPPQAPPSGGS
jgi:hypothetical protein